MPQPSPQKSPLSSPDGSGGVEQHFSDKIAQPGRHVTLAGVTQAGIDPVVPADLEKVQCLRLWTKLHRATLARVGVEQSQIL